MSETRLGEAAPLDAFFYPRSVALVGVPRDGSWGYRFLQALEEHHFRGEVYLVNPRAREIAGYPVHPSLGAIPGPVELAIICVPPGQVCRVVAEGGAKGVKAAVVFTAGFSELGTEEGRRREEELVRVARQSRLPIVGPNCVGPLSAAVGLAPGPLIPMAESPVGLVSQSGFLMRYFADALYRRGLPLSKAISVGNQCDLDCIDFLEHLGRDPALGVLAAYVEGVKDGRRLRRALEEIVPRKPVILWKAGLTAAGSRAAASHTGSLTGSRQAWGALVRQTGALAARGLEELLDLTVALALLPPAPGRGIAIVSDPGGLAVGAADACEENGLLLAALAPETQERLRRFMIPAGSSYKNPVDIGMMQYQPLEVYRDAIVTAAADPGVDAVLVQPIITDPRITDLLVEAKGATPKPLLVAPIQTDLWGREMAQRLAEAGIPNFPSPERALGAYAAALAYWRHRRGL